MNTLSPGLSLSAASSRIEPQAEKELRDVARQFETLFVQTLLKNARAAPIGDDGLGEHGDFVRDQYDATMAKQLSSGKGLGLANMLVRQLSGNAPPVSSGAGLQRSTLNAPVKPAKQADAVAPGTTGRFEKPADFVRALRPHAQRAAAELGVSERIVLAQAALETDWGRSLPTNHSGDSSHNLFGIKANAAWQGEVTQSQTTEFRDGVERSERAGFRSYTDFGESFNDYVNFLRSNPRYEQALDHQGDERAFLEGLQQAGYATDPNYADKIRRVADSPLLADIYAAFSGAGAH